MTLTVRPDPQERAGGYAWLSLPAGSLAGASASVAVFDSYGARWLARSHGDGERVAVGDADWQAERHEFGPYPVERGGGAERVRIGPEIVNKLDEYMPLEITVGGVKQAVIWPDDVPPRAGAAVLGGLRTTARAGHPQERDQLVGKVPTAPDDTVPAPPEVVEPSAPVETARRWPWLAVLVLLLLAGAALAAAWYFWPADDPAQVVPPDDASTADSAADGCSLAALSALEGGFATVERAIRDCGRDVSPDTALSLIETAAARNDPGALLLFGTLYDGTQLDPRIENLIGLTFDSDLARAAEYYARAAAAGSNDARARLAVACGQLSGDTSTLARGAYDDYCK